MIPTNRLRALLCALLLPLLASGASAQQELFVLGRQNKIWRVLGYDGPAPAMQEVLTWTTDGDAFEPTGLEVDPNTGNFWILNSRLTPIGAQISELVSVDPITGTGTVVMDLPFAPLHGLDRRWDGKLYTVHNHSELWLLDPSTGTWVVDTLSASVGDTWATLALDERGELLSTSTDLVSIDPFSGDVSNLPTPLGGFLASGLEV